MVTSNIDTASIGVVCYRLALPVGKICRETSCSKSPKLKQSVVDLSFSTPPPPPLLFGLLKYGSES